MTSCSSFALWTREEPSSSSATFDDTNAPLLLWSFPRNAMDMNATHASLVRECFRLASKEDSGTVSEARSPYVQTRLGKTMLYAMSNRSATHVLILESEVYNPRRFEHVLAYAVEKVSQNGEDPLFLTEAYFSLSVRDRWMDEGVSVYNGSDFDDREGILPDGDILLQTCRGIGAVSATMLCAHILCKLRVAVVGDDIHLVSDTARAIANFAFHRQAYDFVYPIVFSSSEEIISDLQTRSFFVAGFVDRVILNRSTMFEVIVDLNNQSVVYGSLALSKDTVLKCPYGNLLSSTFQTLDALGENAEVRLIKGIASLAKKWTSILQNAQSLKQRTDLLGEKLTKDELSQALDEEEVENLNFLHAFGVAESLCYA